MTPLTTIVIPTRCSTSRFIDSAVRSVMRQSDANWRLLVVVEQNGVPATLAGLGLSGDDRASCAVNRSSGVTGALNTAFELVQTPFISPLHDDDQLTEKAMDVLNRIMPKHPEVDYFHSARRFIDDNGNFSTEVKLPKKEVLAENFVRGGQVKHLHTIRVASALSIGGIDEELKLHGADDYHFPWCLAEAGCTFKAIDECLYLVRDHRSAPRLTTHVPLAVQVAELIKIFRLHQVPEGRIEKEIARRTAGYLQQALFTDDRDRASKLSDPNFDPQSGWREIPIKS